MRNADISRDRRYKLTALEWTAVLPGGEERRARVIGAERDWPSIWVEGFAPDEYAWVTVERFAGLGCRFPYEPPRFPQAVHIIMPA
ncbi:hypothetical protein [Deinococcus soli (ex Cha et al. 2016)]|uniref:Uncharacterized protein n=1 Tax=Deinococcus soli (ex Cha et al. 2016) TaxID=1309411 RepID=A0ACC6KPH4_9DEIO|nr:hypothetical protein [Deinococcus soli (ex Cha et al. 2016)]MDR6330578.1 hypothetical protein [Deinococcus soli (ex Cha et al. 2016)]MDR6754355.1 hypothetical protein [Deinococcus soli (ex Cha et al. 2016)]